MRLLSLSVALAEFVLLISVFASEASTGSNSSSCRNKCGASYRRGLPCQCNDRCPEFNNCCTDYASLCSELTSGHDCKDFDEVTQDLWNNDVDRLSASDVIVNYQARIGKSDVLKDLSPEKLFSYVNDSKLTSRVHTTFLALLDNFDPVKNTPEVVTTQEIAEEEAFLDAVLATSVFEVVYDYLLCEGKIQNSADLRALLRHIWFDFYPRSGSSTIEDTNAFEHVMVGEFKTSGSASGLHSWLGFYEKEKDLENPEINYFGFSCDQKPNVVCAAYEWDGRKKRVSSFLLNVSPAYDLALYSLCYILQPGTCFARVDGRETRIKTFSKDGHITTACVER